MLTIMAGIVSLPNKRAFLSKAPRPNPSALPKRSKTYLNNI